MTSRYSKLLGFGNYDLSAQIEPEWKIVKWEYNGVVYDDVDAINFSLNDCEGDKLVRLWIEEDPSPPVKKKLTIYTYTDICDIWGDRVSWTLSPRNIEIETIIKDGFNVRKMGIMSGTYSITAPVPPDYREVYSHVSTGEDISSFTVHDTEDITVSFLYVKELPYTPVFPWTEEPCCPVSKTRIVEVTDDIISFVNLCGGEQVLLVTLIEGCVFCGHGNRVRCGVRVRYYDINNNILHTDLKFCSRVFNDVECFSSSDISEIAISQRIPLNTDKIFVELVVNPEHTPLDVVEEPSEYRFIVGKLMSGTFCDCDTH